MTEEVHVFRVMNPDVLEVPPFSDLLDRALSHDHSPGPVEQLLPQLRTLLPAGTIVLLIAREGTRYRGLCILATPRVSLGPKTAAVHYLYSDGSMRVSGALVREAAELAVTGGYDRLTITNRNGRDAAFRRLARPYLGRGQPQGTAFSYDLRG